MKAATLVLISVYGLIFLLCALVSSMPIVPTEQLTNLTSNAEIFGVPKIAKKKCTNRRVWIDGKCRILLPD